MVRFKPPGSKTWYNVSGDAGARAATAIEASKKKVSDAKAKVSSKGTSHRGPTAAQVAAGTLEVGKPSTAHRAQAREAALTQSGVRTGMTQAQSAAEATKTVYGASSAQAQKAQAALKKEQFDIKRGKFPPNVHQKLTTAQIHQREALFAGARRETLLEALKGKSGEITKYQLDPLKEQIRRRNLQLQSESSKIQTQNAQLNIYEARLNKYPIRDGVFTGTEKQFEQYKKDYKKYVGKYNQVDTSIVAYNEKLEQTESKITEAAGLERKAQRAKFGGFAGKYEDAERKTSESLAASKTQIKTEHPQTVAQFHKLYGEIKKISELQAVGHTQSGFGAVTKMKDPMTTGLQLDEQNVDAVVALSKREGFKGFVQQAGKKPIKTAAMVGVGLVTPPMLRGFGAVAKTLGAGRKVAIAGKAGLYGMGGMYVVGTGVKYTQVETPYERGAVLGEALFQELIPLFVGGYIGTKAIAAAPKIKTSAPKIKTAAVKQVEKISEFPMKEFNKQLRAIEIMQRYGMTTTKGTRLKTSFKIPDVKIHDTPKFTSIKIPSTLSKTGSNVRASTVSKHAKGGTILDLVDERSVYKYYRVIEKTTNIKTLRSELDNMKALKTLFKEMNLKWRLDTPTYNKRIKVLNEKIKIASGTKPTIKASTREFKHIEYSTVESFMQGIASMAAFKKTFDLESVPISRGGVSTANAQKPKPKPKPKIITVAVPKAKARPKAKAIAKVAVKPTVSQATKAKRARAAAAKKPLAVVVIPIIPIIPTKKVSTKKKPTKKGKKTMKLTQKNLNAVKTYKQLLGSL